MYVNDLVKIRFVEEGYLPNWPYHLISDEEMCDAFLTYPWYDYRTSDEVSSGIVLDKDEIWKRFLNGTELCYFRDKYPLRHTSKCGVGDKIVDESLYRTLVEAISYHIEKFKQSTDEYVELPDWIYSYMLMETIGPSSTQLDSHYMLVMLDRDNDFDEYTPEAAEECYRLSQKWLSKYPDLDHRPPTMFGEPHVLKYLRLREAEMI